jgi:hypothetical protein
MAFAYRSGSSAGNSSGGSIAPSKPAGTVDGDLLIARAYLEDDTNTWSSVPSGWTLAGSIANTGGFKLWVYWKVASGEPASWTWTPTTNNWRTITVDAYSGGVTPAVDVVGAGGQADGVIGTSQTAPSVTSIDDNDLIAFSYGNFSGTNPTTISGFTTNLRTAFGGVAGADATKTPAGATGTSWPSAGIGSEDYAAIHIAFKIGTSSTPTLEQEGFRFRNDDGSETTATWRQSQDTDDSVAVSTNVRMRVLVNAVNNPDAGHYKLQYRKVGDDTWMDVTQ